MEKEIIEKSIINLFRNPDSKLTPGINEAQNLINVGKIAHDEDIDNVKVLLQSLTSEVMIKKIGTPKKGVYISFVDIFKQQLQAFLIKKAGFQYKVSPELGAYKFKGGSSLQKNEIPGSVALLFKD